MSGVKITVQITVKVDPYKEVEVNGCLFRCYESGKVERLLYYNNKWRRCDNKTSSDRRASVGIKNNYYFLHRIIYLAFNPTFDITDKKRLIDHINGDSSDNRLINLREATHGENAWNQKANKNNKLGLKNIYNYGTKWQVRIMKDGKLIVNKCFNKMDHTLDDVILFRDSELLKHHGDFARLV